MSSLTPGAAVAGRAGLEKLRVGSWVLYDFANTVYAATVTYLFIPQLVPEVRTWIGPASTAAMIVAGLLVPALGALCDATGRARTFLAIATTACVVAMAGLSVDASVPMIRTLAVFMIAQVAFQTALVAYNALLPSVASSGRAGTVSGIGTAVGYLGTVAILVFAAMSAGADTGDAATSADRTDVVIGAGALLFLLAALPCLVLVRDRRFARPGPVTLEAARDAFRRLGRTVRDLPAQRPVLLFLVGNFLLLDVVNTAVILFGTILKLQFGELEQAGRLALFGLSFEPTAGGSMLPFLVTMGLSLNLLAMLSGFILGYLTDRTSGLGVMRLSGSCLIVALVGAIAFGGQSATAYLLAVVLPGAIGLAGMWTAGRKVVVQLAPPDRVGEYFGLYGLTTKLSVVGMATFTTLTEWVNVEVALGAQIVPAVVGLVCLGLVRVPAAQAGVR